MMRGPKCLDVRVPHIGLMFYAFRSLDGLRASNDALNVLLNDALYAFRNHQT